MGSFEFDWFVYETCTYAFPVTSISLCFGLEGLDLYVLRCWAPDCR